MGKIFAGLLIFLFLFSAIPQDYRGTTTTSRKTSWKRKRPQRQLKENTIFPRRNLDTHGLSYSSATSRKKVEAAKAAYGEVSPKEYSSGERALVRALERIHICQRVILQNAGKNPPRAEEALTLLRKENKILLPTLYKLEKFPCRFILDNPKEIIRECKRVYSREKKSDLKHLADMQKYQKELLKTHIENQIRARRSFK